MFKNLRKIVLGLLAVCLTGALGAGVAFGVEAHAEETVASVKAFKTTQINLNESITVRYNLTVPAGYTGAEMTFTVGEGGSPITAEPKTGLTEGQNITFELKNIGPQNMADKITATVTFTGKNGETGVETYEMSVKEYCQTLLKNAAAGKADRIDAQEKFDALKTLASSLLVYGDEAQKYVGKEATSTTGLTVAQKNAALKAQASSSDLSFSGEAYKGLLWSGATLWFGNKVNLIYYFKADSALQAQGALGVKVGESFIEAQVGETVDGYTEYSATYEGLSVTEFDSVIGARVAYKTTEGVVTEVGKTANYSVKSYVLRAPEADKALAEAAYSYGVAAKAYTEALGVEAKSVGDILASNKNATSSVDKILGYEDFVGKQIVRAITSDGENIYAYGITFVARYNLETKETVIAKATSIAHNDDKSSIFIVGDELFMGARGNYSKINKNFTVEDSVQSATLTFGSLGSDIGVTYTEGKGYAVFNTKTTTVGTSTTYTDEIYVFNGNFEQGISFTISGSQLAKQYDGTTVSGYSARRIASDENYIYVNYAGKGAVAPSIAVYDWSGKKIATKVFSNDVSGLTLKNDGCFVSGIAPIGNKLYFSVLKWSGGDGTALFELSLNEILLTLGEKAELGDEVVATTEKVVDFGTFNGNLVYASAIKDNDIYIFSGNNAKEAYIARYNLGTKTTVKSATPAKNDSIAEGRLSMFIKDGYVYVYTSVGNSFYKLKLDFEENAEIATENISFGEMTNYNGVSYSDKNGFAVWGTDNKVYFYDKQGNAVSNTVDVPSSLVTKKHDGTSITASSVKRLFCDDNYVYLEYAQKGVVCPSIYVVDWSGNVKGSFIIDNADGGIASDSGFIGGVMAVDDGLYFMVMRWTTGAYGSALFKSTFAFA